MDSIELYNQLKEKHNRQEELLHDTVIEKLTGVDLGTMDGFNANKKVRVDEDGSRITAKSAFVNAYSGEYVERLSTNDAKQISSTANIRKVINLSVKTMENANNLDIIHQYSLNNTERDEKTRNKHRENVNKYANNLITVSGRHREATANYEGLASREELSREEKKILKKEFLAKYKLDLEVIEQEYQMNKHLIKMGGKKDVSEEDSLFRLKYTRYAKALAANKLAGQMARKYPDLFDAEYFQKQMTKIRKKLKDLGKDVSSELMQSKNDYFHDSHTRRAVRLNARAKAESERRNLAAVKEKYGERLQDAIDSYIEKKSNNGTGNETQWAREQLTLDELAKALAKGKGMDILFGEKNKRPGRGQAFAAKFDEAMELFIDRYLYDKATTLSTVDYRNLRSGGVPDEDVDRCVRSQLHPVRKLNSGEYVSKEDEQNDIFNRKYIDSFINNKMDDRKECIEENFKLLYSYDYDMENFDDPKYYFKDGWKRFMLLRMNMGASDLCSHSYTGFILDSKDIAREVRERWLTQKGRVEVNGRTIGFDDFIAKTFALYGMVARGEYNVNAGDGELTVDETAEVPEAKTTYKAELEEFAAAYKALKKS